MPSLRASNLASDLLSGAITSSADLTTRLATPAELGAWRELVGGSLSLMRAIASSIAVATVVLGSPVALRAMASGPAGMAAIATQPAAGSYFQADNTALGNLLDSPEALTWAVRGSGNFIKPWVTDAAFGALVTGSASRKANWLGAIAHPDSRFVVETFTKSGLWQPRAGVLCAAVLTVGAGGCGQSLNFSQNGGGGGSGQAKFEVLTSIPLYSVVVVGMTGTLGVPGSPVATGGGASSFGTLVSASGGAPGNAGANGGPAGTGGAGGSGGTPAGTAADLFDAGLGLVPWWSTTGFNVVGPSGSGTTPGAFFGQLTFPGAGGQGATASAQNGGYGRDGLVVVYSLLA